MQPSCCVIRESSHAPNRTPYLHRPLPTLEPLPVSWELPVLGISHKWNHTSFVVPSLNGFCKSCAGTQPRSLTSLLCAVALTAPGWTQVAVTDHTARACRSSCLALSKRRRAGQGSWAPHLVDSQRTGSRRLAEPREAPCAPRAAVPPASLAGAQRLTSTAGCVGMNLLLEAGGGHPSWFLSTEDAASEAI